MGATTSAPPSTHFPDGDALLLILEFVSTPLVVSLVCWQWRSLLEPGLNRRPFEIVQETVNRIVAVLEVEHYVTQEASQRDREDMRELDGADGEDDGAEGEEFDDADPPFLNTRYPPLLNTTMDERDLCAADFFLSAVRFRPVPHLTKTTIDTLVTLSPADPDDDISILIVAALRTVWANVLNREVPGSWGFHCMDGDPTAGNFDDPFGVFDGAYIQACAGGDDFSLSVGTISLQMLQNGAEYYCRLGEEEKEEMWEDECNGTVVPKGSQGSQWCQGGALARGRAQGCSEIHITVRGCIVLEVTADRVLHGPAVPPFTVRLWGSSSSRLAEQQVRMWLPWASRAEWEAWVTDDESRWPILHGSSAPLVSRFPLPLSPATKHSACPLSPD